MNMPLRLPDVSPVIAGINNYLNNRAPFDAWLASARERGLTVTYDGYVNKLLISPRNKLTEADTAFIRKHREELVQALIMAKQKCENAKV